MYEYNAKLNRVVDGDTVDLFIDVGFNITINQRVRLYGIDAPETRTKDLAEKYKGLKSSIRLSELLLNKKLTVKTFKDDKYGRILAIIFVEDVSINEVLISEGLASPYIP